MGSRTADAGCPRIVATQTAVLAAISIPIFNSQLEKSREATDVANLRNAYAVAAAASLDSSSGASSGPVSIKQTTKGWQSNAGDSEIGGKKLGTELADVADTGKKTYYVSIDGTGAITFPTADPGNAIPITGSN